MKKPWIYGAASLALLGMLTTACSSKGEEEELTSKISAPTGQTQTSSGSIAKTVHAGVAPSIDAQISQDGRNATINYSVNNLTLSTDHMGKQNVQGEGHLHLYVDGKQKAMLGTDAPVKLTNLATGKHEIKLMLQHNDHSDLSIEKIFNIEVK